MTHVSKALFCYIFIMLSSIRLMSITLMSSAAKQKKQDQNIFLQKTKTSPNDLITPFNNKINNSNDLNTYNNEINRMDTISHEIIEKDKEIQELKNSIQQYRMEMDAIKLKQNISNQIEQENKNH